MNFGARRICCEWPVSSAAQANVGVQGNSGHAEESQNPTFLTHMRHWTRLTERSHKVGAPPIKALVELIPSGWKWGDGDFSVFWVKWRRRCRPH